MTNPVRSHVDLSVAPGERLAIVGENGAGKTTSVKLLLGLYVPDEGSVMLNGVDMLTIPLDERQRRLSAVFQQSVHYPWSLEENVTLETESKAPFDDIVTLSALERMIADFSE